MMLTVMGAFRTVYYKNADWSTIHSFQSCGDIADALKTKEINIIRGISVAIYSITEFIYSIVILRLFVSNVLKLSLFCQVSPINAVKIILSFSMFSECESI